MEIPILVSNNTAQYTLVGGASNGCDSIVTLDLTIETVDDAVIQLGDTLMADQMGATYQWIDCDNGNMPIVGAVDQFFVPTFTGNYAVEITLNNCTITSACQSILVGINNLDVLTDIVVYPNPADQLVNIDLGTNFSAYTITMQDISGRVLYQDLVINTQLHQIEVGDLPSGMYLIQVVSDRGIYTEKLIKE